MDTERVGDKKFIPMSGEIGNSQKDKNLGTTEASPTIDAEESPGPWDVLQQPNGPGHRQRRQGSNKDGTTSVTSVMRRLGVDWDIKGRRKEVVRTEGQQSS